MTNTILLDNNKVLRRFFEKYKDDFKLFMNAYVP